MPCEESPYSAYRAEALKLQSVKNQSRSQIRVRSKKLKNTATEQRKVEQHGEAVKVV